MRAAWLLLPFVSASGCALTLGVGAGVGVPVSSVVGPETHQTIEVGAAIDVPYHLGVLADAEPERPRTVRILGGVALLPVQLTGPGGRVSSRLSGAWFVGADVTLTRPVVSWARNPLLVRLTGRARVALPPDTGEPSALPWAVSLGPSVVVVPGPGTFWLTAAATLGPLQGQMARPLWVPGAELRLGGEADVWAVLRELVRK